MSAEHNHNLQETAQQLIDYCETPNARFCSSLEDYIQNSSFFLKKQQKPPACPLKNAPVVRTQQYQLESAFQAAHTALIYNPTAPEVPSLTFVLSSYPTLSIHRMAFSLGWAYMFTNLHINGNVDYFHLYMPSPHSPASEYPQAGDPKALPFEKVIIFSDGSIIRPSLIIQNPALLDQKPLSGLLTYETTAFSTWILDEAREEMLKDRAATALLQAFKG